MTRYVIYVYNLKEKWTIQKNERRLQTDLYIDNFRDNPIEFNKVL